MFWRHNIRSESTLSNCAEHPGKHIYRNLFAVVMEITAPLFCENYDKYLTRVKIVDQSFNFMEKSPHESLKFHKFALLNIYSNSLEEVPKINRVGDIIRLYFARFFLTSKGEMACYTDEYCDWQTHSADLPTNAAPLSRNYSQREYFELSVSEQNYLNFMIIWSQKFLSGNILKDILWWNSYQNQETKSKQNLKIQKNVDLLVKYEQFQVKGNYAVFVDKYGNSFKCNPLKDEDFDKKGIYKIGGVSVKQENVKSKVYLLERSNFTGILKLPEFAKDFRNFTILFEEIKKEQREECLMVSDLSMFENKENSKTQATLIDKRYDNVTINTPAQLVNLLKNPLHNLDSNFVLEGKIKGFSSTNAKEIIKRFILENREVYPFNSIFLKNLASIIIYNFVMQLEIQGVSDLLDIYVCSTDTQFNLFEKWNILPEISDLEKWQTISEKTLQKFERKLKKLEIEQMNVKIVVKLLITKTGRPFFKLVDTIFA